jgi:tetratricopeptide (TPR) repeat protein
MTPETDSGLEDASRAPGEDLSLGKRLLFSGIVLALFLGLGEGLLALAGIEPRIRGEDPYVGFAGQVPLFLEARDENGTGVFETAANKRRFFNEQRFAAEKPVGGRRLFCVGGSTTYGRPYFDATSFCGWLRELLPAADPSGPWEVVNAGGISYASYRVAALLEELARHRPDFVVIYTGHNEFLEERTYASVRDANPLLLRLGAWLRRSRIDAALRGLLARARRAGGEEVRPLLAGEVSTILDRSVGPDAYRRDDALRERVLEHYRFNLERIVELTRGAGAEPLLVVPASNLRDCRPFKSQHSAGLDPAAQARWRAAVERGRTRLAEGDAAGARQAFSEAVGLDPRRADAHYGLAGSLLALGQADAAARSFRRARDEDVCPLRALTPMRSIVLEVAAEWEVPLVDFEAMLERRVQASLGHPVPGEDWFLDHVHPTIEGHRRLALAIVDAMLAEGWVDAAPGWGDAEVKRVTAAVLAGIDPQQHGLALRNLAKVLSWAGKSEEAARIARRALGRLGDDAECHFILGAYAGERARWEEAIEHYRQALVLEPDYTKARNNLGAALARTGRPEEAIVEYERVLAKTPGHGNARYNLANAYLRTGRLEKAIAHYREVLRADPDDADAHFNLARTYLRRGDRTEAERHLVAVLDLEPDDAGAREELARVRAVAKSPPEAGGASALP